MNPNELKPYLTEIYNSKTPREILNPIIGSKIKWFEHLDPQVKEFGTVTRLGQIVCDDAMGSVVDILDVEDQETQIHRSRVGLKQKIKSYFNGLNVQGVLAFFHGPGQRTWRLSLATKRTVMREGKIQVVETEKRRYTYALGPGSAVKTPAHRLSGLKDITKLRLKDLEDAFSVEAVTKEFFDRYRGFYEAFTKHLSTDPVRSLLGVQGNDKPIRDFVKKLLGRLVFLKFLEKKGWLGAKEYQNHDGDSQFLFKLFQSHRQDFYAEALVPLFFETMNQYRPGDLFRLTETKVPYLNGGLFEPDYDVERVNKCLSFPAGLFEDLLGFFGEYNFTVDEHDDGDEEIGVDPEMLGRIFEQLIEDNEKDMNGTIYTPYPVVEFMCQTSLHLHLCKKLKTESVSEMGEALHRLIIVGEATTLTVNQVKVLKEALSEIKVLDPAVGSGAFPLGMMKELVKVGVALDPVVDRGTLKRHIIKNTLYGVDIDRGAVDIARLRMFLALVVDSPMPEALPNLDFKIIQGDSLSEAWDELPLVFPAKEYQEALRPQAENLFGVQELAHGKIGGGKTALEVLLTSGEDVLQLLTDYTDASLSPEAKLKAREKIEDLEKKFISSVLENDVRRLAKPLGVGPYGQGGDDKVRSDENKLKKAHEALAKAQKHLADFQALGPRSEKPYFLWHLYFHDAFKAGGWDIIIGNPPYRANQENENDQAKNKEYPLIDKRIKDTFVKKSTAQKTKVYDLFSRFFRLVFDFALASEKKSIVGFITNSGFVGSRTYDGFRKEVKENFNTVTVLDLKGNARTSGTLRQQQGGNIFNDAVRVGIAMSFYELDQGKDKEFLVQYAAVDDYTTFEEKVSFVESAQSGGITYQTIVPDAKENWIGQTDSDWDELIPLCSKDVKLGRSTDGVIFKLYSLGIVTARDSWLFDFDKKNLENKVKFTIDTYEADRRKYLNERNGKNNVAGVVSREIKYTSELEGAIIRGIEISYSNAQTVKTIYRPYGKMFTYYDDWLTHRQYQTKKLFSLGNEIKGNSIIAFSGLESSKPFQVLSIKLLPSYDLLEKTQCVSLKFLDNGDLKTSITHWAMLHISKYFGRTLSESQIFAYVYGVLHNPAYRAKYAVNLTQDYPRIPLYGDFDTWADWGQTLLILHAEFEEQAEYQGLQAFPGDGHTTKTHKAHSGRGNRGEKVFTGEITFNDGSILRGIPPRAFDYKLGNKSAIEWILDQYVETSYPTDDEIAKGRKLREDERVLRDRFNTFRFADYKDHVISLIKKVITISLSTLDIQDQMAKLEDHGVDLREPLEIAQDEMEDGMDMAAEDLLNG